MTSSSGGGVAGPSDTAPLVANVLPAVVRRSLDDRIAASRHAHSVEADDERLDPGARILVANAYAESTRKAYRSSWARFNAWYLTRYSVDPSADPALDSHGRLVQAVNANEADLANYVAHLNGRDRHGNQTRKPKSAAYIDRELAAITKAFDLSGLTAPTKHITVRDAVAGGRRDVGTKQRQAIALRLDDLRTILNSMAIITKRKHTDPVIRRDRALLALGWAAGLRREELVAIDVEHLAFQGDPNNPGQTAGVVITIPWSKTDQGKKTQHVAVSYSSHPSTCPVRATLALAKLRYSGPLFVSTTRHGKQGQRLSAGTVNRIVKANVERSLGYDTTDYTSHSLRAGLVTELRAHGTPAHDIMKQTRHRDLRMLAVYNRPTDLLENPVLQGEWW
jgi:integrase